MIIIDRFMPSMIGAVLAQELLRIYRNIPIILCTDFSDIINKEKAKALCITAVYHPPLVKSQFSKAVRAVLDEREATFSTIKHFTVAKIVN